MQNRREFLKVAGLAAVGAGLAVGCKQRRVPDPVVPPGGDTLKPVEPVVVGPRRMKLRFYPYELQLQHTFTVSSYSRNTTPDVQVEIDYQGYTGYGEASMPPYLGQSVDSVTAFLEKVNLEQFADPFCLEDILAYVDSLSPGDSAAKAAVDIALHDLVGKLLGAPWYRIWGYNPTKAPSTTFTIGIDTPEVVQEKTRECVDRFNIDRFQALDMIYWLRDHGVVLVEQPMAVNRIDDLAWLRERSRLPIFGDESVQGLDDVQRSVGVFDGINIKLMKCGGLRNAHKMVELARGLGLKVMLGCMTETSCAVSAAAQLSPAVDFADLDGNLLITNDLFDGVGLHEGKLVLPDRPGIGVVKRAPAEER